VKNGVGGGGWFEVSFLLKSKSVDKKEKEKIRVFRTSEYKSRIWGSVSRELKFPLECM
jgi:hypothetical protein